MAHDSNRMSRGSRDRRLETDRTAQPEQAGGTGKGKVGIIAGVGYGSKDGQEGRRRWVEA